MNFPVQDPFWTETAAFVRDAIGPDKPFVGPREFRPVMPKVFPYDWVHAIEILDQFGGVIVHKGLMHELPVPVLQTVQKEWKCVFANEVFLFFMPVDSALSATSDTHLQFFHEQLESMEKLARITKAVLKEVTAVVVIASHAPSFLEKTLASLSLLHAPVFVVAATADAMRREAYRSVCSSYHARLDESGSHATVASALKSGVGRLLEDADTAWIASFDDTMLARPDFLLVMERLRSAETRPVLGGLWMKTDGIRNVFSRDGLRMIIPRKQGSIHCYGHREYWKERFFGADNLKNNRAANSGHWRASKPRLFPPGSLQDDPLSGCKSLSYNPGEIPALIVQDLVTLQASA